MILFFFLVSLFPSEDQLLSQEEFYHRELQSEYLEIFFHAKHKIYTISIQGRGYDNLIHKNETIEASRRLRRQYIKSFRVTHSISCQKNGFVPLLRDDLSHFREDSDVFIGNSDSYNIVRIDRFKPFSACCIRIHPVDYNLYPCMKIDLEGYREKTMFESFLKHAGFVLKE
jgi:uncharacterized protein YnzC (UPF0291/DUF896 family)